VVVLVALDVTLNEGDSDTLAGKGLHTDTSGGARWGPIRPSGTFP